MSRTFVRTWATVVTVMALACFAFVQPMPDSGLRIAAGQIEAGVSEGAQITEAPPFVETVLSGKTFTPFTTISVIPAFHTGGSQWAVQHASAQEMPEPPPDPLIRPG